MPGLYFVRRQAAPGPRVLGGIVAGEPKVTYRS
jgi:hypothetical protein